MPPPTPPAAPMVLVTVAYSWEGRERTGTMTFGVGQNWEKYRVGERLTLFVDPGHPKRFRTRDRLYEGGYSLGFILAFISLGCALYVLDLY
jgi:hypothetical protein